MTSPLPQTTPPARPQRHYRLTHQEWQEAVKRFKYAELKVLYYLRTLDPFGDRWIRVRVTDIARELEMSRGTASDALKVLADMGEIDLEISTAKVRLNLYAPKLQVPEMQELEHEQSGDKAIATAILDRHSEQRSLQRTSQILLMNQNPLRVKVLKKQNVPIVLKTLNKQKQMVLNPPPTLF